MPKKVKKGRLPNTLPFKENISGAMCYILGLITGIIFFILGKDNKFVKFHAVQSIIFSIIVIIISQILSAFTTASLMTMYNTDLMTMYASYGTLSAITSISWVINIVILVIWIFVMYKAYLGEKYHIPIIGNLTERVLKSL